MPTPVPKLREPIVLVHGLFGFDRVQLAGLTMAQYFPGIRQCLERAGNRVIVPSLSPTGAVAGRAQQLKEVLQRDCPDRPVHILAHSMGGLDARYMISRLGMADRVLSLTTLGTPHRGTAFADWAIGKLERLVRPVLEFVGLPTEGFYDLTTDRCRAFNASVPDAPGVRYFSVAGEHDGNFINWEWLLPYTLVFHAEGANDGVVSVASATWGENLTVWQGDHFSLVNWYHPWSKNRGYWRDPAPRLGQILDTLTAAGF